MTPTPNMSDTVEGMLKEIEGRVDSGKKAGCLPADSCVWALPDPYCIFCGRESGQPMNMYREEWNDVAKMRDEDTPRLIAALRRAVEHIEACDESDPCLVNMHAQCLAQLAALLAGEGEK